MNVADLQSVSTASLPFVASDRVLDVGEEVDWEPDHLTLSAWLEHVPFAFWIVKALRPSCLVELGTERGVSYAAFCQAIERLSLPTRCYAVDTWRGDEHAGHYDESVYQSVAALTDRRYSRFATLLRMTFAEALPHFADGEVDLLHIDGLHTYEAVAEDFRTWRSKLSERGVVVFHDINVRRDDFGVWRLWRELSAQFPHFSFNHGYGLGILGVGRRIPAPLQTLFQLNDEPETQSYIRRVFASRGVAVRRTFELAAVGSQLQGALTNVTTLQGDVARLTDRASEMKSAVDAKDEQVVALQEAVARGQAELALAEAQYAGQLAEMESLREQLAAVRAEANETRALLSQQAEERHWHLAKTAEQLHGALKAQTEFAQTELAQVEQVHIERATAADGRHAARVEELESRLRSAENHVAALLTSTCWQITYPVRAIKIAATQPVRALRALSARRIAVRPVKAPHEAGPMPSVALTPAPGLTPRWSAYPPKADAARLAPRVLIVAELAISQCRKYRVDQKQQMIESLGWDCTTVAWQETDRSSVPDAKP